MFGLGVGILAYLLANASPLSAEDRVSTQQTRKEAVIAAFLPGTCGGDVP
jgi:hypothetical protein